MADRYNPSFEMKERTVDFEQGISRHCGGRLTPHDAELLYETAMAIRPKNILEIGCMDGCSSMLFGMIAQMTGGKVQSIEPKKTGSWIKNIDRHNLQDYVEMFVGKSPWVPIDWINKPIDYLFIDGDHRTRWAIVDYHYWCEYVRIGGMIAFHDWGDPRPYPGDCVREAVEIILRDDDKVLKKVAESKNKRGTIVFEKVSNERKWV